MRQHNLRLSDELIDSIDQERGLIPRNAWIVDVLSRHLQNLCPGQLVLDTHGFLARANPKELHSGDQPT